MSELPADRAERYQRELGLSEESARLLAFRGELGGFFDAAVAAAARRPAADARELGGRRAREPAGGRRRPGGGQGHAERAGRARRRWSPRRRSASAPPARCSTRLIAEGGEPSAIVEAEGLAAIDGGDELAAIVAAALEANPDAAQRVREGNAKAIGPIVGHVMRETRGRADGTEVSRLITEQLAG